MSVTLSPKVDKINEVSVTSGGNITIESGTFTLGSSLPADDFTKYRFTGSSTLGSDLDIVIGGSPKKDTRIFISWEASVTLSGNNITVFGTTLLSGLESRKWNAICTYDGSSWQNVIIPSFDGSEPVISVMLATDSVTTAKIINDAVTTAKILDANVTLAKLEAVSSGNIIVGNSSNRPTSVAMSGDVTISNTGVTTIGAAKVLNAMIDSMDASKLTGTIAAARIADDSLSSDKLSTIQKLSTKYSDTGTTAVTTEETLFSYTLPAGTLDADGEGIRVTAYGSFAATANAKTVRCKFGGNTYITNAVTTSPNGVNWKAQFDVLRAGATSAVGFGDMVVDATLQGVDNSKAGITWANANDVEITGQNGTAALNDIVLSQVTVEQIR